MVASDDRFWAREFLVPADGKSSRPLISGDAKVQQGENRTGAVNIDFTWPNPREEIQTEQELRVTLRTRSTSQKELPTHFVQRIPDRWLL